MCLYKIDTILYREMVVLNTFVVVGGSHGKKGFVGIDREK